MGELSLYCIEFSTEMRGTKKLLILADGFPMTHALQLKKQQQSDNTQGLPKGKLVCKY